MHTPEFEGMCHGHGVGEFEDHIHGRGDSTGTLWDEALCTFVGLSLYILLQQEKIALVVVSVSCSHGAYEICAAAGPSRKMI